MKRLIKSESLTNSKILLTIFLFLSLMILMTSCEDSMDDNLLDSTLIEQIKNSDLTEINFNTLPESSQSNIQNIYIPSGDIPMKSFESPSLGYKVNLLGQGRTIDVFFNTEGRELIDDRNDEGDDSSESCWDYSYPITLIMSDSSEILIENEEDWTHVREWEESNPNLDIEITLVFPITIIHEFDDQTTTIESYDEIRIWEEQNCN